MAIVHIYRNMKPRSHSDPAPKPHSAMKVLGHVKRAHKRRGIEMVPLTMAYMALKGLLREYAEVHGY